MPGIFISYRREDSPGHAGRIFDRLRSRFGSDVVFMDVTAIEAGVDFVEVIHKAVGSCDALLAVIGPQWMSATHDRRRRLDDPHDFVRLEIAGALERNVRVLPVLVEGASLPATGDLPADLQKLTRRQAIELRDARWDDDIERLVEGLEKFLQAGSPSRQPLKARQKTPSQVPPAAGADRPSAKTSTARSMAIGALAALFLVIGAVVAWRGGLAPGRSSRTATDPQGQTAGVGPQTQAGVASATAEPGRSPEPKPVEPAPTPPAPTPTTSPAGESSGSAKAAAVPDVTGKTILEAREILRNAGFLFRVQLSADRTRTPGIVESQRLDESAGSGRPRVILNAVATSSVFVHVVKGDERKADALAAYLRDQPSTIGSIVRGMAVSPRAEGVGRVSYSEERLAAQAEAIAKDVSGYLARAGSSRTLRATLNSRVGRGSIIVVLYERAQ